MLMAMAELPGREFRLADVASKLRMEPRALGLRRSSLIGKGMIFCPRNGIVAFTVPLFAEYMKRTECGA